MNATLLLPPGAPEEEWKAARRQGVTASEIAVILGISPYDSAFNLYWKKLGELPDDFDNTAMSLGRHLEPWIADQWAADHPGAHVGVTGLWRSDERPWQMATPDRYVWDKSRSDVDGDSLLEIKSSGTYDGWGEDGSDQIPAYYRAQVLWQLDTLGMDRADVTCFFLSTRQRRDYTVAYDVTDVYLMRAAALDFMEQVERRTPPDIDAHTATLGALKALNPKVDQDAEAEVPTMLALDYEAACEAVRLAGAEKALLENRLRDVMGTAKYAMHAGHKIATRSVYDVAEHVRRAGHVDKLISAKTPKDPS